MLHDSSLETDGITNFGCSGCSSAEKGEERPHHCETAEVARLQGAARRHDHI